MISGLPLTNVPTFTEVSERSIASFEYPAECLTISYDRFAARKELRFLLAILKRLVCDLQQNALLRINGLGFSLGDVEKLREEPHC